MKGLDEIDWPSRVKKHQKWWIGESKGLCIDFKIEVIRMRSLFLLQDDALCLCCSSTNIISNKACSIR